MFSGKQRSPTATACIAALLMLAGCQPAQPPETAAPLETASAPAQPSETAAPTETVSPPTTIEGPDWSYVVQFPETYSPGSASSSMGHSLEYRIDWGDGNLSDWTDQGAGHNWEQSGEYPIKAQARCKDHPEVISPWSEKLITVSVTWE